MSTDKNLHCVWYTDNDISKPLFLISERHHCHFVLCHYVIQLWPTVMPDTKALDSLIWLTYQKLIFRAYDSSTK